MDFSKLMKTENQFANVDFFFNQFFNTCFLHNKQKGKLK